MCKTQKEFVGYVRGGIANFKNIFPQKGFKFLESKDTIKLRPKFYITDKDRRWTRLNVKQGRWFYRRSPAEFIAITREDSSNKIIIVAYAILFHRESYDDIFRIYVSPEFRCGKLFLSIPQIFKTEEIVGIDPRIKDYTNTRIGLADVLIYESCKLPRSCELQVQLNREAAWLVFRNGFTYIGTGCSSDRVLSY